jgi:hypothetical protein
MAGGAGRLLAAFFFIGINLVTGGNILATATVSHHHTVLEFT